jgi:hypothetical protein
VSCEDEITFNSQCYLSLQQNVTNFQQTAITSSVITNTFVRDVRYIAKFVWFSDLLNTIFVILSQNFKIKFSDEHIVKLHNLYAIHKLTDI